MLTPILDISIGRQINLNQKVNVFEIELEFQNSDNTYQSQTLFYKESDKELLIHDLNVLEKCEQRTKQGMSNNKDYHVVEGFNSKSHGIQQIENVMSEKPFFKHWDVIFPNDPIRPSYNAFLSGITLFYYNESGNKFQVDFIR